MSERGRVEMAYWGDISGGRQEGEVGAGRRGEGSSWDIERWRGGTTRTGWEEEERNGGGEGDSWNEEVRPWGFVGLVSWVGMAWDEGLGGILIRISTAFGARGLRGVAICYQKHFRNYFNQMIMALGGSLQALFLRPL